MEKHPAGSICGHAGGKISRTVLIPGQQEVVNAVLRKVNDKSEFASCLTAVEQPNGDKKIIFADGFTPQIVE